MGNFHRSLLVLAVLLGSEEPGRSLISPLLHTVLLKLFCSAEIQ